jgi:hypothetical protein
VNNQLIEHVTNAITLDDRGRYDFVFAALHLCSENLQNQAQTIEAWSECRRVAGDAFYKASQVACSDKLQLAAMYVARDAAYMACCISEMQQLKVAGKDISGFADKINGAAAQAIAWARVGDAHSDAAHQIAFKKEYNLALLEITEDIS